jgi:hypothetical protein
LLCDRILDIPNPLARLDSKFPRSIPLTTARKIINTNNKFFLFIKNNLYIIFSNRLKD